MPEELSELLERVAADGTNRSALTAGDVRTRGAGIRRRRTVGGVLGAAVLVSGVLAGAVLGVGASGGSGTRPGTAAGSPSHGVASTTVPTPPRTGPKPCQDVARPGDVDGDCRVDAITITGDTLVVRGTHAGRMTVRLTGIRHPAVAASTDINADGFADVWIASGRDRYAIVRFTGTGLVLTRVGNQVFGITLSTPLARYLLICSGDKLAVFVRVPTRTATGKTVILVHRLFAGIKVTDC
jgi:hypothetical protein